jgi:AAA family ATP:ADP antiporter
MSETAGQPKNPFESLLSIITAIKPGEGLTAVLMAVNLLTLLAAYYVLKPVREAYVTTDWANTGTAIMALLLIPMVKAYGAIARKFARKKLISYVIGFFISNLVVFYLLAEMQFRHMGVLFFIWVGVFNNMVVAQFWAYGNDIYTPEQGKRLFPLIMLGSSIGAIAGPLIPKKLGPWIGTNPLLLLAGIMLGLCIALTVWIDNREKPARTTLMEKKPAEDVLGREGGFELVWKHRYLFYLALMIIILNVVNTTGEQIRRETFNESARVSALAQHPGLADPQLKEAVKGIKLQLNSDFFFWVNLLSILVQGLLVSRLLKILGVRGALLLIPIVVFLGYGAMAFLPSLLVVRGVKIVENSQDYSLMNTLRAALYLPLTRDMKYKAKQVIDTFFVRLGDLIASGIWFIGFCMLGLDISGLAGLMLVFVAGWLVLAVLICREHKTMVPIEKPSGDRVSTAAAAG